MNTLSNLFANNTLKIAMTSIVFGALLALPFIFFSFNARVTSAQSAGGPTAWRRFTVSNPGGQVTKQLSLGQWAFCMLVENKIDESGGGGFEVHHSCRLDGSLNSPWTLVSYDGNHQNGQCSAFCARW